MRHCRRHDFAVLIEYLGLIDNFDRFVLIRPLVVSKNKRKRNYAFLGAVLSSLWMRRAASDLGCLHSGMVA